jgi:hypothetical protein
MKFSSHLTVTTLSGHYKDRPVNAVCCVVGSYGTVCVNFSYVAFLHTAYSYALKMEVVVSSETLVCIIFHSTSYTE